MLQSELCLMELSGFTAGYIHNQNIYWPVSGFLFKQMIKCYRTDQSKVNLLLHPELCPTGRHMAFDR